MAELRPRAAGLAPEIADELPGLSLHWLRVAAGDAPSPPALTRRLQELANRYRGPSVIAMRTQPVPAAYRRFFRQIGLDPDVTRPPGEQAAVMRLFDGTFCSQGQLADALLVALLETGVPVWALNAGSARGEELTIRTSASGERLGGLAQGRPISPGTLVVADLQRVHAVLFETPAPDSLVSVQTSELVLFSVSVPGVPAIHVEEAFWLAVEALRGSV